MTPKQTQLYFHEWGEVREHYLKLGIDSKQIEAKRHQLHLKALGVMKSSKVFTNADFDKVLAVFRAITQPGNLEAQLHALDQPAKRLGKLQGECRHILHQLPRIRADVDPSFAAEHYLDSIAKSLTGRPFEKIGEKDAARVLGILNHRLSEQIAQVKEAAMLGKNCPW